ncbi:MAG TPA: AMP-binding protein [Gemmatimonadales bacterium]|nr:AMP-binding protein [Gemmatimonadales bacterium]
MSRVGLGQTLRALSSSRVVGSARRQAAQDTAVRRLVRHAAVNVPYYRDLLAQAGVAAQEIRSAADLARIPISTKADLLAAPEAERIALGFSRRSLLSACSSGITGEPFTVLRTWGEQTLQHCFALRAMGSLGVRPTDRIAAIHFVGNRTDPGRRRLRRLLGAFGIGRTLHLDVRRDPAELADELVRCRPHAVLGYPAILDRVSQELVDRGIALAPRVVITGGEVLQPRLCAALADRFGAPVRSLYGSIECQLIAAECPAGEGFHVCDGNVVVEVLRKDGTPAATGEVGEVVVTPLRAYAMPFIRYRLGDLVVAGGRCRCGGALQTLKEIQGRMMDYLVLPGGRRLHPFEVTDRVVWDHPGWARRFQLVQERENRVVMRTIAARQPDEATINSINRSVGEVLGSDVEFALELVNELPHEPSGKFRLIRPLASVS